MKKTLLIFLSVIITMLIAGCSGATTQRLGPGDMLDNDTQKVFSLGQSRLEFDEAFEVYGVEENGNVVQYLGGVLEVTFDETGNARIISCEGGTNRFSFYGFTFDTPIEDIKGRYEKMDTYGFAFYSRYYDDEGKDAKRADIKYTHTLMVRVGDQEITGRKDGQYIRYEIELEA